jgi:hypothetical protein
MNREQESVFAMALKVKNFNAKHSASMAVVPAVTGFYTQLDTMITQLIIADTGSRADLTGYALSKSAKRTILETLCQKISNAMGAYSVVNNDAVLQKKTYFPTSKWYLCSEEELITQATIVNNLATPMAANLAPFGATAADVTSLGAALINFTDVISDPSLAIDQRKEDNEKVVDTIDEIRSLLNDKLDVLMRSFEVNDPSLFSLYRSARALDINGTRVAPTAVVDVLGNSIKTVHTVPVYQVDTFYTLHNMGTETLQFSLSDTADTEGDTVVVLNGGETRTRLAENLSATGKYFTIKNANAVPVTVRLWVE